MTPSRLRRNTLALVIGLSAALGSGCEKCDDPVLHVTNNNASTCTIFLDGSNMGTVASGGTSEWTISEGSHSVTATCGAANAGPISDDVDCDEVWYVTIS
ncbi:MAG: hypothetical protein L0216_14860 [Planctomycetales bacterium]|nr:hypothetical protein [Planctomycetales bacterium]